MATDTYDHAFDRYIVARMALWAGDFDYFDELVRDLAPRREFGKMPDSMQGAADVLRYCAALRSRQLAQKRGEFSRHAEAITKEQYRIKAQPETMKTAHLRATIWRRGPWRFVMRAFLDDLGWESQLLANGAQMLQKYRGIEVLPPEANVEFASRSWVVPGSFIIEVSMGDMGLVEAEGLWNELERELTFRDVLHAFEGVLLDLDPSEAQDSRYEREQ